MTLVGKVALVLGASAQGGIGWTIAEALAAEGARLIVAARRLTPLRELAEKVGGLALACDASRPEDIQRLAMESVAAFGSIDIAVNAAGETAAGLIRDIDPQAVQRALDVNYIAHFHFLRAMAAAMPKGGAVTLISSAVSTQPVADRFAYGCAKAALDCLVRHAALEFGPVGIRVNSVLPGPVRTELVSRLLETPGVEDAFVRQIPAGRIAMPQDIADIVVWLSRPSGYVTGLNLPASGGMHLTRPPSAAELSG